MRFQNIAASLIKASSPPGLEALKTGQGCADGESVTTSSAGIVRQGIDRKKTKKKKQHFLRVFEGAGRDESAPLQSARSAIDTFSIIASILPLNGTVRDHHYQAQ